MKIKKTFYQWSMLIIVLFSTLALLLFYNKRLEQQQPLPQPKQTTIAISIINEPSKSSSSKPTPTHHKAKAIQKKAPVSVKKKSTNATGSLPPISVNYRKYLGFKQYARLMRQRGCHFYLIGNSTKHILEIKFSSHSLKRVKLKELLLGKFSPRTRIIEDEPALDFFLNQATKKFNLTNPRVILMVPLRMEQSIIAQLTNRGITVNNFSGFKGEYLDVSAGIFTLKITEGITIAGSKKLNIQIKL